MPGLWRRALGRGAHWRLLVLTVCGVALPAALGALPILSFLGGLFDRSNRARELVAALDSSALIEVLRQLEDAPAAAAIPGGMVAAAIACAALAPALAGAALAVARAEQPVGFRDLLRGAGEYYGRLLRMMVAAAVPLGIAAALAAAAFHFARVAAETAVLEAGARRGFRLAQAGSAALLLLAQITLDAGRAHLAAQPERRSAFRAWWSGVVLVARHPARVLALCAVTAALGLGLAGLLTAAHLRVHQTNAGTVALAFALAQLAVAAVAWDRASRLSGLTELVRADLAERASRRAAAEAERFEMAPPVTSPAPAAQDDPAARPRPEPPAGSEAGS